MKRIKIISVLSILFFSGMSFAKAQNVFSLNPLFTEQNAVLVPEIEGSWTMMDFDWVMSLKQKGDNFYHFNEAPENKDYFYEAVFLRINNELLIDLKGTLPDNLGDSDFRESFLPIHSIYKATISNDSLFISSLNYEWFYDFAVTKKLPIEFEWVNNGMLLTSATDELQSFFYDRIPEEGIFNNPDTIIIDKNFLIEENTTKPNSSSIKSVFALQQHCSPIFPFKNGWLGGDGDVSVTFNDTTTIFIFSDTFVGNKNQKSRQEEGLKMVSNTLAVQTCLPDGDTDVQYYWNKMYSNNPEPFFRSFTNRYKYWVVDAFTSNTNLYVILAKIGQKPGAAPDEIFNFSGMGFSLAKISNPCKNPADWEIEFFPLSDFKSPNMEIRCHAKQNGYVYFFISRNDTSQFLVRKQIENIENHKEPFEYYSLKQKWEQGLKADDLFEITKGFRCNSVNFHPDINLWVMISDVRFMDNKIKMRTSPTLTGPWSDEKVIYEIPEMTPGNVLYNESNFSYLAREHIQYYNPKNQKMLITYDVNNTNFSELISNLNIYIPKVIKVTLDEY